MITVVNIGTISPGKGSQAVDFTKRAAEANNKALPGINSSVMRPTTGNTTRLMLVNTFESHGQREQFLKDQRNNPEWQAISKEMAENEYFVPGTMERYIYDIL